MSRPNARRTSYRCTLDQLEGRNLLAAQVAASFSAGSGLLEVIGTKGDDVIIVKMQDGRIMVDGLNIKAGNAVVPSVDAQVIKKIALYGLEGNDTLGLAGPRDGYPSIVKPTTIKGGLGNDFLYGSDGPDSLWGGRGRPPSFGRSRWLKTEQTDGRDEIYGNAGGDVIDGSFGNDLIHSGDGNDTANGGDGDDFLDGGDGVDILYGGAGNDSLWGHAGGDSIYGGDGDDQLNGWDGNDSLYSGAGNDQFFGGEGLDELYGKNTTRYNLSEAAFGLTDLGIVSTRSGKIMIPDRLKPEIAKRLAEKIKIYIQNTLLQNLRKRLVAEVARLVDEGNMNFEDNWGNKIKTLAGRKKHGFWKRGGVDAQPTWTNLLAYDVSVVSQGTDIFAAVDYGVSIQADFQAWADLQEWSFNVLLASDDPKGTAHLTVDGRGSIKAEMEFRSYVTGSITQSNLGLSPWITLDAPGVLYDLFIAYAQLAANTATAVYAQIAQNLIASYLDGITFTMVLNPGTAKMDIQVFQAGTLLFSDKVAVLG